MTKIPPGVLDEVFNFCQAAYPFEACGLLVGKEGAIVAAAPCANLAADPRGSFRIDPGFHLRLQRSLREKGLAIVGTFHSHPDGEAAP